MKLVIAFLALTLSLVFANDYSNRYDDVRLDQILSNKRLLQGYMRCVLDKGPCTPEGKDMKVNIVDVLKTGCNKCSDRNRQSIKKVIQFMTKNEPEFWKQAIDKYDPDGTYTKMYEKKIENW